MQAPRQPGKGTKVAYAILGKPPKKRKNGKGGVIERNRGRMIEDMTRTGK